MLTAFVASSTRSFPWEEWNEQDWEEGWSFPALIPLTLSSNSAALEIALSRPGDFILRAAGMLACSEGPLSPHAVWQHTPRGHGLAWGGGWTQRRGCPQGMFFCWVRVAPQHSDSGLKYTTAEPCREVAEALWLLHRDVTQICPVVHEQSHLFSWLWQTAMVRLCSFIFVLVKITAFTKEFDFWHASQRHWSNSKSRPVITASNAIVSFSAKKIKLVARCFCLFSYFCSVVFDHNKSVN